MSARSRIHAMFSVDADGERELDTRLDAYRAEVLAGDGQAYDGELAMLRGLVATLRAVAEHGDLSDVRKLLAEYQRDDAQARAEGKSSQPADATPRLAGRRARLLDAIRTHGGRWDVGRVLDLYELTEPGHIQRVTARRDLGYLQWCGHLKQRGPENNRSYTLKTAQDGA
ncbi:hypothetical protein ACIQ9J_01820 [Streptomyces sp. NPDC094153]|uniref:hypothetical protein n=1 Tax=Streptomyces sp. NPDC094153 TaxID=3366058 RepID=UPI0038102074